MKILIRDARILTMDDDGTSHDRADILIEDRVIRAVGAGLSRQPGFGAVDREINGDGHLVMPGLVNGHFHSPVNHLKGALRGLPLEIFMLYETPSLDDAGVSPREAYVRTMLGALEMLKTGATSVQDDAFFIPTPREDVVDAVLQAYADCGIRATVALDQPNVPELQKLPFLAELLPAHLSRRLSAPPALDGTDLLACYRRLLKTWHGHDDGRLRAAVSCSAPQRVTPDYFAALDDLSRTSDLPFYVHILETKLQRVFGLEKLGGRSLVRYVHDLHLLSDRLNIIHAIWLDDADMDLIADAGSVVAHNPISNLRLGSGVMPFRQLRNRGIPICLGSDEAIADDAINMWAVAKVAGLIHTISDPDYELWPSAHEILRCLIGGGARAMRSADRLGRIAPGYQADLIMLDLDTAAFTPLNDIERQLVYCEGGGSVRLTMVAGRIVVENGKSTMVDEVSLRAEAREHAARFSSTKASIERAADELLPFYRQMYLRASNTAVGMNRRIDGDLAWAK